MLIFSTLSIYLITTLGLMDNFPYIKTFKDSGKSLCRNYNSMSCFYRPEISEDIWIFGGLQPDNEGNAVLDIQKWNFDSEECEDFSTQTEWFTNFITGVEYINGKIYYNHYESDYIASYKFDEHATTIEAYFLNNKLKDNFNLVITSNKIDTIYITGGNLNVFWKWNINHCSSCIMALNQPNYHHFGAPVEYYNGYVYIFGGMYTNKIERFDTSDYRGNWEVLDAEFSINLAYRQSIVLSDTGLIYLFGENEYLYYFNTADNTLIQTDIMLQNNPSKPCIVDYMNTLLVIGGENNGKQVLQSNHYGTSNNQLDLEIKIKSKNYKNNDELALKLETEGMFTAEELCKKVYEFFENYH